MSYESMHGCGGNRPLCACGKCFVAQCALLECIIDQCGAYMNNLVALTKDSKMKPADKQNRVISLSGRSVG